MGFEGSVVTVIALLTDFGTADGYVGAMHGVILRINPAATVVDVCHEIPPQDVRAAAFVLSTVYPYFAADTIHVAVVDPGVGTERQAIAVGTARGTFVAPDNGVLSYVLAREQVRQIVRLSNAEYWLDPLSSTFHGRDVFAPVAAHLSRGIPLSDLGPPVQTVVRLTIPVCRLAEGGAVHGEVLYVDRFGNLITNLTRELLPMEQQLSIHIAGRKISGPVRSYAQVGDGELLALFGSSGYLEIAARNASAAAALRSGPGTLVVAAPLKRREQRR
jgi:S-adenosylmethionine hydrolase